MAQIAFISICFFALAPLNRTMPHHLATIQEHIFFGVVELLGALKMKEAVIVEAFHIGFGYGVLHFPGMP